MPETATLKRRNGVELIRTGTWPISTGVWTATRDDLAAAVAAMSCPAVRRPVLKVGHSDQRFTAGDGEPAIGWVEHLRLADGGHTLVGDYVGVPEWVDSIMASAWPDRSVEGDYNYRCQLGHSHPFALTGVALLGVTPPGVGTLRSLSDVKALYGIAAASEPEQEQAVRIAATITGQALQAAAEVHTGAMVALLPAADHAERIAVDGGEPVDQLHVTLMYLGQASELNTKARAAIVDTVRRATTDIPLVEGDGFNIGVFNPPGVSRSDGAQRDTCIVLGVGGQDLADTHSLVQGAVLDLAAGMMLDLPQQHRPWVPHLTLEYTDDLAKVAAYADRAGPVVFDRIRVAYGGETTDIPLTAVDHAYALTVPNMLMPVTAASDAGLRNYWVHGEGAAKIRWNTGGDYTRCVRHLRKHVSDPEGLCAEYHHQATGMWPGDRRNVKAHASEESAVPNPQPSLTERIHAAWNASGQPEQQWIVEAAADQVIVMDNTDRSLVRVPVTVDGDTISFGTPVRVRPAYVPDTEPEAAGRMVFASAEESRPGTPPASAPPAPNPADDTDPAPAETEPEDEPDDQTGTPEPPAAEPEPNPEPTEEDPVSLSETMRSRLGLDENADEKAALAAIDALITKADQQPNPEQVAAAAEKRTELEKEVQVLAAQVQSVTAQLAATKAAEAATVKASVLDAAVQAGKIAPADREQWAADYDAAPAAITRVLATIAAGTAVPVSAAGYTGTTETGSAGAFDDAEYNAVFGVTEKAGA